MIALFVTCSAWLVLVALLRLTTARPVPIVNVRWAKDASVEARKKTASDLSLVLDTPRERDTASYFVLDAQPENLGRVVMNPLVEDTAYIDRNTFILVHPPSAQMWIGDEYPALKLPALIYVSLTGFIVSGVALELDPTRRRLAT